jgi:hypothetical protein
MGGCGRGSGVAATGGGRRPLAAQASEQVGRRGGEKKGKRKLKLENLQKSPILSYVSSFDRFSVPRQTRISAHCNEFSQSRWFFAISRNSGGFAYFPHKCGGFLELPRVTCTY